MKTKRIAALLMAGLLILMMLCLGTNVYAAAQNTTKTNITKLVEKAEGKIYLTWSKKSVDGYQIRWALNSKMTGAKTASFTETEMYRSGLIGGKTYYFQVRTYKKINGKKVYSNWSSMKSIKLKKLPPTTTITSLKANSSSSFTVKWTKKSGVKGYQIRYSTDSSFKMMKTASTSKNTHTRKDLAKGTYYVSVRSYNVAADGTKYYSRWSGMKSVTLQEDYHIIFETAKGNYRFYSSSHSYNVEIWTVKKDGLFTARMDNGPYKISGKLNGIPYSTVVYYSNFSGKLRVIKKLNAYTYELALERFQDHTVNDKSYVKNKRLFQPLSQYYLSELKHFYLFIPNTPRRIIQNYIPSYSDILKMPLDEYSIICYNDAAHGEPQWYIYIRDK